MQDFKTFLFESKNLGELYHICDYKSLKHIITEDKLESKNYGYVSLTRDKLLWPKKDFIISIDGGKLSNNYVVKPYAYQGEENGNIVYFKDEREEAVIAKAIVKISKYINFIAIRDNASTNLLKYGYDEDFQWVYDDKKENVLKLLSNIDKKFGLKVQKGSSFTKDDKWFKERYLTY